MQLKNASAARKTTQPRPPAKIKHRINFVKQFQQFKERIQSFQDKNQSIINRIRDAYSFKRKTLPNIQLYIPNRELGKQYEVKNDQIDQSSMLEVNEMYETNLNRISSEGMLKPSIKDDDKTKANYLSNSLIYDNLLQIPQKNLEERKSHSPSIGSNLRFQRKPQNDTRINQQQPQLKKLRTEQKLKKYVEEPYNPNENISTVQNHIARSVVRDNFQPEAKSAFLEQKWNKAMMENRDLLKFLQNKEKQLHRYKSMESKFKSCSRSFQEVVKEQLENFFEDVLVAKIGEMQKYVKKCENKIKKLSSKVSDVAQQRRNQQIIQNSRLKRMLEKRLSMKMQISSSSDSKSRGEDDQDIEIPKQIQNPFKIIQPGELDAVVADYEEIMRSPKKQNQSFEQLLQEEFNKRQGLEKEIKSLSEALQSQKTLVQQLRKNLQGEQKSNEGLLEQLKHLKQKLNVLEEELKRKQVAEMDANFQHQKLKKSQQDEFLCRMQHLSTSQTSITQQLKKRLTEYETASNLKSNELKEIKENLVEAEKRYMQKQCEIFGINTKLKKIQNQCAIKEIKLKKLEAMLLKQNDTDLFDDKSFDGEDTKTLSNELKELQDHLKALTLELQEKNLQIDKLYNLKRQNEEIRSTKDGRISQLYETNKNLSEQVELLTKQLRKTNHEQNDNVLSKDLLLRNSWLAEEEQNNRLSLEKMHQDNSQLHQELQKVKQENLSNCRELIRLNSQCSFNKNEIHNWEVKFDRLKQEKADLKRKIRQMEIVMEETSKNHLIQIEKYIIENHDLKKNIQDLQSRKQLRDSLTLTSSIKYQALGNQFRHWQKDHNARRKDNMETIQDEEKKDGQLQIQSQQEGREDIIQLTNNQEEQIKIMYQDKIRYLEADLQKAKQSELQLSAIMHQLFQNTKTMEDQNKKLLREVSQKQKLIDQLRDLLELKEVERQNRESQREQERKSQIKETTHFSFKLSADYSDQINQFMELSCLSNISDIFKRDDILQDKIKNGKTSRQEQVMLYSKTSVYIKSLKTTIEAKEKKIKFLEKQLVSIKSQENSRWSAKQNSNCSGVNTSQVDIVMDDDDDENNDHKQMDSIQIEIKSPKQSGIIKQLESENNLITEQNKMLTKQIQVLRVELQNAEQQENSLMKIKDLYKDEIKRLIEKNEKNSKQLEDQVKQLEERLEQSESYHNLEAIKQLFLKIIGAVAFFYDCSGKSTKKQQKKKQLEEYIKVMCSLLLLEVNIKDKLLANLRK